MTDQTAHSMCANMKTVSFNLFFSRSWHVSFFFFFFLFLVLIFLILYGITTFKNEYIFFAFAYLPLRPKIYTIVSLVWLNQTMIYFYAGLRIRVRKLDIWIVQMCYMMFGYILFVNKLSLIDISMIRNNDNRLGFEKKFKSKPSRERERDIYIYIYIIFFFLDTR